MTPPAPQFWWHTLPVVNASLNSLSALFLLAAFIMIKRRNVVAHATLIIFAVVTSTAFLTCYVLYHTLKSMHGEVLTRFPPGPWHPWYMALLWPHLILAIVMLPLICTSLWLAWKRNWKMHRKVASVTFPLWFYVSVTGVMVYFMLYHLAPTLPH